MLKIGLCDDNDLYIDQLSSFIKDICNNESIDIEITTFNSGKDLINFCDKHKNYFDILFLDILMNEMNGIDTAKSIREMNFTTYIIFVTSSRDYALDSYSVNAYSYILKPFSYECIKEKLLDLKGKISIDKKNTIYVKNNYDIYTIRLDNTIYFESNLRKITAHMVDGEKITFYNKMSDLENQINNDMFLRCHRSFLVNLSYVKSIVSSNLYTIKNDVIPISKKYLLDTRNAFTDYVKSKLSY